MVYVAYLLKGGGVALGGSGVAAPGMGHSCISALRAETS